MPSSIITSVGLAYFLRYGVTGVIGGGGTPFTVRLFTNDVVLDLDLVDTDLDTPTFDGYGPVDVFPYLPEGDDSPGVHHNGWEAFDGTSSIPVTFHPTTDSGPANDIYGWALLLAGSPFSFDPFLDPGLSAPSLLAVYKYDAPITLAVTADVLTFTPILRAQNPP